MTPAAKPSEAATTLGVAMLTQNTTQAPTEDAAPAPTTCGRAAKGEAEVLGANGGGNAQSTAA